MREQRGDQRARHQLGDPSAARGLAVQRAPVVALHEADRWDRAASARAGGSRSAGRSCGRRHRASRRCRPRTRRATATARCPCRVPDGEVGRISSAASTRAPSARAIVGGGVGGSVVDDDDLVDEADALDQVAAHGGDDLADRGLLVPRGKADRHDGARPSPARATRQVRSRTHGGIVEVCGATWEWPSSNARGAWWCPGGTVSLHETRSSRAAEGQAL